VKEYCKLIDNIAHETNDNYSNKIEDIGFDINEGNLNPVLYALET